MRDFDGGKHVIIEDQEAKDLHSGQNSINYNLEEPKHLNSDRYVKSNMSKYEVESAYNDIRVINDED